MRTVRVEVTAEDIKAGKRESAEECPIALACRRAGLIDAVVGEDGGIDYRCHPDDVCWTNIPDGSSEERMRFVGDFDSRRDVQPFAFEVELP